MKGRSVWFIRLITFIVIVFAIVLTVRLYFIQVVYGDLYSEKADRQYLKPGEEIFDRGDIYFETKEGKLISAATLNSGYKLAIIPSEIVDSEYAYRKLNELVPTIDKDTFIAKASKKFDPYEDIEKKIDEDVGNKIASLNIPGVKIYKEKWRYYPGGSLASQTLGFISYNGDLLEGQYGLERYYEDVLERNTSKVFVNFFAELFSGIQDVVDNKRQVKGDIVLTIEPFVQAEFEKVLEEINKTWSSQETGGIIINPNNGEIYAIGSYPDFDPNYFFNETDINVFSNPLVEDVYEFGSIIKPLTIAAGLDSKSITAETTYYDAGNASYDGKTIYNYDGKGRGTVNMQEVLNQSLNTGVAKAMELMGKDTLREYFFNFGLGEETGIDLPNEASPLFENMESPRLIEYATASFGQGIAMNAVSVAKALSSLGNGGKLISPHIVKKVVFDFGGSKTIEPDNKVEIVLKKETSEEITRMLVKVVDEALLGGTVSLPNHSIAAKTGTAQIADGEGGYYNDRYMHSFFGYFPAYKPEFLVLIYTIDPKGVQYASQTLTVPFMNMTEYLINYYEIPPDRNLQR